MTLILMATGGAGLLVSFGLLHAGLARMWLRYPLAILCAYGVFLLLLRLWLAAQSRRKSLSDPDVDLTGVDLTGVVGRQGGAGAGFGFGGAGDFAGGGAGGAVDGGTEAANFLSGGGATGGGGGSTGGGGGGLLDGLGNVDLDIDDEGCGVVIAAAALALAIIAGLLVSFYVVWAAPALLAEILVDGLLVAGLYKRVKGAERRHWLRAAVRRTILPVALTVVSFTAAGYAMQWAVPEARSVGEFWKAIVND